MSGVGRRLRLRDSSSWLMAEPPNNIRVSLWRYEHRILRVTAGRNSKHLHVGAMMARCIKIWVDSWEIEVDALQVESVWDHRVYTLGVRNEPCGLMPYGWNKCKSRVDALSYINSKPRVDTPGTSDLMLLDSVTRKQNMSMHSMMICDMNWKTDFIAIHINILMWLNGKMHLYISTQLVCIWFKWYPVWCACILIFPGVVEYQYACRGRASLPNLGGVKLKKKSNGKANFGEF